MDSPTEQLFGKFAYSPLAVIWNLYWSALIIPMLLMACLILWIICSTTNYFDEPIIEIEMNKCSEQGRRGTEQSDIGQDVNAMIEV